MLLQILLQGPIHLRHQNLLPHNGIAELFWCLSPFEQHLFTQNALHYLYYETVLREEELMEEKGLLEHALQKHMIPVSPNSFYAYLQAIALGLRGMQIEQQAKEFLGYLGRLEGDFRRLQQAFGVLGTLLENARKKYEESERFIGRFSDQLEGTRQPGATLPGDKLGVLDAGGKSRNSAE